MKSAALAGIVSGVIVCFTGTAAFADGCGCGCDGAKEKTSCEVKEVEADESLAVEHEGKTYFACDKECYEKLKANPAECIKTCTMKLGKSKSGKKGFVVYGHGKVDSNNTKKQDIGNTKTEDTGNTEKQDDGNIRKQDTGNTPKQTKS